MNVYLSLCAFKVCIEQVRVRKNQRQNNFTLGLVDSTNKDVSDQTKVEGVVLEK